MYKYFIVFAFVLFIFSCRPTVFIPKPPGYYKLDTPLQHSYILFDSPNFPYSFEIPVYSKIMRDTVYANKKSTESDYWINIYFPDFQGIINITYKDINKNQPLDKLNAESFEMSFFHHEKAAFIDHTEFFNAAGITCLIYTIGGNVATRYQFTATDTTKHFMRGVLYFDVTPNADSLKPISDFVERDIEHLLMTLKWK